MKKVIMLFNFMLIIAVVSSQSPKSFRYQAVLRDASGKIIANQDKTIVIELLQGSTSGGVVFTETHNITTTDQGLINLEIGSIDTVDFELINWANGPYFMKISLDGIEMGISQLLSVPYSMFAGTVRQVKAPSNIGPDEPIFQVLNTNGDVVFAVYNSGVRIVFDENATKGARSGFAVGGRSYGKQGVENDYLTVTKDSTSFTINDQLLKGARSGFRVGGRNPGKGTPFTFMNINPDSTTFFVRSNTQDVSGTSFNIMTVGTDNIPKNLLSVTTDSTRIGTSLNVSKDIVTTGGITGGTVNTATFTDNRDGRIYKTVTIGNQIWMAENLRTEKYLNGNAIPNVKIDTSWTKLISGAYCYYNNDSLISGLTYGALYNYYAVVDSRGICPTGWHVPKVADFQALANYLGGDTVAGGKLKSVGNLFWIGLNVGATNSSGFSGLPGGTFPPFMQLGLSGNYWTTTESSPTTAISLMLNSNSEQIVLSPAPPKTQGFSVRCMKD